MRGSVPLYWSQTGIKYKPPPRIEKGIVHKLEIVTPKCSQILPIHSLTIPKIWILIIHITVGPHYNMVVGGPQPVDHKVRQGHYWGGR